jgi:hypothetical protein
VPGLRVRGAILSLPKYVSMAWCLVKYRDNFTFYLTFNSLSSTAYIILSNILVARLSPYVNEIIEVISVGFVVTDLLPIRLYTFHRY